MEEKNKKDKYEDKELLEEASDKLAKILIAQIEFNQNKNNYAKSK